MLSVTLENRDGVGVGTLTGHPASVEVRTRRLPEQHLHISLWDHGVQIGEGTLRAIHGRWVGQVSEFAGRWFVSGAIGTGVLAFAQEAVAA